MKQQVQTKVPSGPNLRGRQTDTYRILEKILNSRATSRLVTLIGWPGVGKSALVANLISYISKRNLLLGGTIYMNACNFQMCDRFI